MAHKRLGSDITTIQGGGKASNTLRIPIPKHIRQQILLKRGMPVKLIWKESADRNQIFLTIDRLKENSDEHEIEDRSA